MPNALRTTLLTAVLVLASTPVLAAMDPQTKPEIRVGILLFDGVQIIDFAGPYEVFGDAGFGVTTVSHDGAPVTTAMGLKVTPDTDFASAPAFDVLLVPGGDVGDAERDADVLDFVRKHTATTPHVLSVCTGAFILAGAGVLDGLQATTFTPRIPEFDRRYPAVDVIRDVRWSDTGRIVTSAGLSSGLDAALHIVAKVRGTEKARSVALHLEYDWNPDGGFVRSRMADRYVPAALETAVDWPKDLAMRKDFAIGDEQQWRMHFDVATATPAADLMQRIASAMDGIDGWTRQAGTDRWTSEQEGRKVTLAFDTAPGATEQSYTLDLRVQAGND